MPSPVFTGFERRVVIGVAEFAVANNPSVILTTYSLGSCLGVSVYDPVAAVGGLLHLMLPDSTISPEKAAARPAMFVDTGLPALLRGVEEMRAARGRLQVCVAGGAQLMDAKGYFNIGKRNYDALSDLLRQYRLTIQAQEVGGFVNRTMYLNVATGEVRLKVSGQTQETILCNR